MKKNVQLSILFGGVVLGLLGAGCPPTVGDPCLGPVGTKCPPDEAEGGTDGPSSDAPAPVDAPAGCDAKADPKDSLPCVDNSFGVFVSAAGNDANAGTKEAPLKTIGSALSKLAGKARIYICEGTYAEHVKVTQAVSLYGGFACSSGWTYSGTKGKIAPTDAGYALEVVDTKADVIVSDLSFLAPNAAAKGESSIAAFVHGASRVLVLRSTLEAGLGKEGDDGAAGTTGAPTSGDLKGNPAVLTTAGGIKTCTCSSGGTSTGGAGGGPLGAGAPGLPNLGGAAPVDGLGGLGTMTGCLAAEPNGSGNVGADSASAADAPKATTLGALTANGWTPQVGNAGANGTPGQGGGGGGGRDVTSAGGGGACGGCGGTGGKPGGGGGASVALLSLDSAVVLRASTLTAKAAGQGGAGGAKSAGAAGGTGGNGGPSGCAAGDGGRGGDGGSGGGGAGGISAAVLHKGAAPTNDGSTLKAAAKGDAGIGGTAGVNDGPNGQSGEMVAIQ